MWVAFNLGSALLEDGQPAEAKIRFETVINGTTARAWEPLVYVRSFYQLGEAEEQLGNTGAAKAAYQRFLDYWGDGNIDPERVEYARQFVASN